MPTVNIPEYKNGDILVDCEEKVFEDVKALPGEKAFIPGICPINPLDVLDIILVHQRANAVMIHSWNL